MKTTSITSIVRTIRRIAGKARGCLSTRRIRISGADTPGRVWKLAGFKKSIRYSLIFIWTALLTTAHLAFRPATATVHTSSPLAVVATKSASLTLSAVQADPNWGFFGHQKINALAVFLLPPEMLAFYKPNITFISEHAVDPDKRRYLVDAEGPRHYIDIDTYGVYPYTSLPRNYDSAVAKFSEDSVQSHGIVPWWTVIMLQRLTRAFREKDAARILKLSAELGHYVSDAHVPLHASHNHNGQYSNQKGIHGFWESRIPELLADKQFDFFLEKAAFVSDPSKFIWSAVLASAAAADTVLRVEKELNDQFPPDQKYAFETRNGKMIRQYSTAYTVAYDTGLKGMVERRMRQSIHATACYWYTAWVNAGQPSLNKIDLSHMAERDTSIMKDFELQWKHAKPLEKSLEP